MALSVDETSLFRSCAMRRVSLALDRIYIPYVATELTAQNHRSRKDQTESLHPDSVEVPQVQFEPILVTPLTDRKTVPSMSQLSQTRKRIREIKILRTNKDRASCSNYPIVTYCETNPGTDRDTDTP